MGDGLRRYNLKLAIDGKINRQLAMGAIANLVAFEYNYGSRRAVQTSFRSNGFLASLQYCNWRTELYAVKRFGSWTREK